jgi:GrpB-like predicted nucleotidyltransferase (UPF0157 family)
MKITLSEYCDHWKREFECEQEILTRVLGKEVKAIEHVGSTSISGQIAKPVIDIILAVSPFHKIPYFEQKLNSENYRLNPTEMVDRYLFSKYCDEKIWTHNLHVLPFDNGFFLRNEILFRDYMRKRPDLVKRFNCMKKELAMKDFGSLEGYTKAKTPFIQEVVDLARIEKGLPRQNVWTMVNLEDE